MFDKWVRRCGVAALVLLASVACLPDDLLKASDYGITAEDKGAIVVKDAASGFTIRGVTLTDEASRETNKPAIPNDRHDVYEVAPGKYKVRVNYYGTSGSPSFRTICESDVKTKVGVRAAHAALVELMQQGRCNILYKPPTLLVTERRPTAASSPEPTEDSSR